MKQINLQGEQTCPWKILPLIWKKGYSFLLLEQIIFAFKSNLISKEFRYHKRLPVYCGFRKLSPLKNVAKIMSDVSVFLNIKILDILSHSIHKSFLCLQLWYFWSYLTIVYLFRLKKLLLFFLIWVHPLTFQKLHIKMQ